MNQSPHYSQQASQPINAAVFQADQLARAEPYIKRLVAGLLLLTSTFGNYICFNGGWDHTMTLGFRLDTLAILALALAFCYQAIVSYCQFVFAKYWKAPGTKWLWYHIPLWGSVIPSLLGFAGLIVWYVLGPQPESLALVVLCWLATGIVVTLIDIIPEQILVER